MESEIRDITEKARERAQEAELLRLGLAEVERVAPQPGEDLHLRAERNGSATPRYSATPPAMPTSRWPGTPRASPEDWTPPR